MSADPTEVGSTEVVPVPPAIDGEQVRLAVRDLLGREVAGVARLAGSVANQDFVVECRDGSRLVLKAGPATEIAAETWACGRLVELEVPVPAVLVAELDPARLGRAFLVMDFVAGEPTDDAATVREAGGWFRRVHEQQLPGWGPVVLGRGAAGEGAAAGRWPSWRDAVEADLASLPALVAAGVLEERLADRARTVTERLDEPGAGVLLHHDLKPAHLLGRVGDGHPRLSAVLDWGDASVGDPVAEVARLSMAGPAVTAAFLAGYGWPSTSGLADQLARHRVLWDVRALGYELRAGGDWFDTYRRRIGEDTARLLG